MNVQGALHAIDGISTWIGKAFAWLIVVLMSVVCIEVFKRYILNAPTAWIFDAENMLYGTLFMMCGAYTLAQNGHVRGDFLYSSMRPRVQAGLDLALYFLFFIPGILALIYAGYDYAALSWRISCNVSWWVRTARRSFSCALANRSCRRRVSSRFLSRSTSSW